MTDPTFPDEELLSYLDDPTLDRSALSNDSLARLAIFESTASALRGTALDLSAVRRDAAVNAALSAYDLAATVATVAGETNVASINESPRRRTSNANRFLTGAAAVSALLFGGVGFIGYGAVNNKAQNAATMIATNADELSSSRDSAADNAAASPTAGLETAGAPSTTFPVGTEAFTSSGAGLEYVGALNPGTEVADASAIAEAYRHLLVSPGQLSVAEWWPSAFCPTPALGLLGPSAVPLGAVDVGQATAVLWVATSSSLQQFAAYELGACTLLASGNITP